MAITEDCSVRVLHVDDEPGLADMVADFLEQLDHRLDVEPETRPRDVVDGFVAGGFDAVVSDYDMPGMNGLELLDAIRDVDRGFPFILYTGKGNEEIASEAITRGVTDYMQKDGGTDQYSVLANRIVNAVERYRAERTADTARDRFQAVFERAFDAMVISDDDGRYIDVNSAACALFDRSESDLLGRTPADLTVEEFDFSTAWETFKSAETDRGLFPVRRPGGEIRIAEYAATSNIRPGEHLSVLRDVTDQQKVEKRAELERERLREFAGVLSHDLKNPVSVARAHLKMLEEGATGDERAAHLESMERAVLRIEHVIEDVLAISSTDRLDLDPSRVSLSGVASDVWERVGQGTARADVEGGMRIYADERHLERLLTNLFRNAIEHCGPGVHVGVGRLDGGDGFYVEDDGPGIPPERRESVFDWKTSTKEGGTGIGLRSVKQIVDAAGWEVSIATASTGGTRFEISGVDVG